MEEEDTNPKIIALIKDNSNVLEFGPADGRMTKYLNDFKNCNVDIVEIDEMAGKKAAEYANIACIGNIDGDIEGFVWCEKLNGKKYDYVIFADVLEHLHMPDKVLNRVRDFLSPVGLILVSIPNIAHNIIINNLLNNKFEYKNTGLLDDTHVKFFSRKSFERMITKLGMEILGISAVIKEIDQTEFPVNDAMIFGERRRLLFNHNEGNVYQYIFTISEVKNNDRINNMNISQLKLPLNKFYFMKCFWTEMDEEAFCEEKSELWWINPYDTSFMLEFSKSRKISKLRIDILNSNCKAKIKGVYLLQDGEKEKKTFLSNASHIYSNLYIFIHSTPQIILTEIKKKIEGVKVEIEYLAFDENNTKNWERETEEIAYENKRDALKVEGERIEYLENQYKKVLNEKNKSILYNQKLQKDMGELSEKLEKTQNVINEIMIYNEKLLRFYEYVTKLKVWKLIQAIYSDIPIPK